MSPTNLSPAHLTPVVHINMAKMNKMTADQQMAAFDRIDDALRACESLCLGWLPVRAQLALGGWLCARFGRRAFG
jgi:hypothetical protein